jgi:hypothetical protein
MEIRNLSMGASSMLAISLVALPAAAQTAASTEGAFNRDKNVSVRDRRHPEYDALGMRIGAFVLSPTLTLGAEHSDNIYGVSGGAAQSDTHFVINPAFELSSDWNRHQLTLLGDAEINRYADITAENSTSWLLGAKGELDVLRDARITGGASAAHLVEARTSSNSPSSSQIPIEYDRQSIDLMGVQTFNRLRFTGRYDWDHYSFDNGRATDGDVIDQSYRDRYVNKVTARADYALTPDAALFVQVTANSRNYRNVPDVNRDSSGGDVVVGADFQFTNVLRGDVGVGWLKQNFDGADFGDVKGYSLHGKLEWFPTQLTTVTGLAERSIEDSGLVGSAGSLRTDASLQVDHELLRNLILTASLEDEKSDFVGVDRTDKRVTVGASATYQMNRGIGVTVGYSHLDQKSSGENSGSDFKVNVFSLGLVLRR